MATVTRDAEKARRRLQRAVRMSNLGGTCPYVLYFQLKDETVIIGRFPSKPFADRFKKLYINDIVARAMDVELVIAGARRVDARRN